VYYREDAAHISVMAMTGWYRWGTSDFVERVHHTLADHFCFEGVPVDGTWVTAPDMNGAAGTTRAWQYPSGTAINLAASTGFPTTQGLSHFNQFAYAFLLPWRDEAHVNADRYRQIVNAAYTQYHGASTAPNYIGSSCGMLLYHAYERIRAAP